MQKSPAVCSVASSIASLCSWTASDETRNHKTNFIPYFCFGLCNIFASCISNLHAARARALVCGRRLAAARLFGSARSRLRTRARAHGRPRASHRQTIARSMSGDCSLRCARCSGDRRSRRRRLADQKRASSLLDARRRRRQREQNASAGGVVAREFSRLRPTIAHTSVDNTKRAVYTRRFAAF